VCARHSQRLTEEKGRKRAPDCEINAGEFVGRPAKNHQKGRANRDSGRSEGKGGKEDAGGASRPADTLRIRRSPGIPGVLVTLSQGRPWKVTRGPGGKRRGRGDRTSKGQ